MAFVSINNTQLEVKQIAGKAELAPLVFLHEGLGSVSLWTQRGLDWPQAVCEATGRAGLVYSRRGYGRSDPVPAGRNWLGADYMHREAWEVLPALLAKLQLKNPVLLGHSDGATIALLYASRSPVTACIAMAPHVLVEDLAVKAITQAKILYERSAGPPQASSAPLPNERGSVPPEAREATSVGVNNLRQRLAKHHADVDGAFWQWNDVWLSEPFSHFDIRPECRDITAPLLLVQGIDDEYGTMRQLDEIAAAVPHAQQLRLADCGHSPQRDQPQKTIEAMANFLKATS